MSCRCLASVLQVSCMRLAPYGSSQRGTPSDGHSRSAFCAVATEKSGGGSIITWKGASLGRRQREKGASGMWRRGCLRRAGCISVLQMSCRCLAHVLHMSCKCLAGVLRHTDVRNEAPLSDGHAAPLSAQLRPRNQMGSIITWKGRVSVAGRGEKGASGVWRRGWLRRAGCINVLQVSCRCLAGVLPSQQFHDV